jgi:hypothetical protein
MKRERNRWTTKRKRIRRKRERRLFKNGGYDLRKDSGNIR